MLQAEGSNWKPVRNCGHVKVDERLQGNDLDVAHELLLNTVKNLVGKVRKFDDHTRMYPFLDRERQSLSMLLPSFADAADVVYCEQPIPRGKKRQMGYLDYWILYKGDLYFVEVKAAFHAVSKFDDQERDTESPQKSKRGSNAST